MPLFGSHLSIAGGYYKAANAAGALGMDTVQIFTKNNNQWKAKPLTDEDADLFRAAVEENGLKSPCSHDSYLINLASPDDELWEKSLNAYVIELERAEKLGLAGVVMHPGSYLKSSEEEGLAKVIDGLNEAHRRTKGFQVQTWVEATAGQGTNLGYRFEHLGKILREAEDGERFGVCLDTCHIFAAGYGLKTSEEYEETMQQLDEHVGIPNVRAMHLNDSKKEQGSRVDRHDHIGEGFLGLEPFRFLLNDSRFQSLPMYLETKKEKREGEEMDAVNLRVLKSLIDS
ncbi:Endonuclease 4 [Thalassoglobus neptunius]|uniref:Probable endonuclease 4 n=1 Tax=Thalassoglobus neptunius TaxID=1938619 RepID=A0A5C5WMB4_9PLAN|nr:deoxyribonuclease IV [Thalassoglobus neptunius]TWT51966.1 Endonuclease 4 [Thalassoglobus neptunius]